MTGYCRSPAEAPRGPSPTSSIASSQSQALTPSRHLSDAEKLRKVLTELIDTERTYVKVGVGVGVGVCLLYRLPAIAVILLVTRHSSDGHWAATELLQSASLYCH